MNAFLSIKDAAEYLGVEYKTVYRLVKQGALPAGKVGGVYRIRREDLEAYFEAQIAKTAAESKKEEPAAASEVSLRCGRCFRLIPALEQCGGLCEAPGCEELLCELCWEKGEHLCHHHMPSREDRLAQALADLAAGRLVRVVRAVQARQQEMGFIARFEEKVRDIAVLQHPLTEEMLHFTDADWAGVHRGDDQQEQLLQLLGTGYLERRLLDTLPLGLVSRFQLDEGSLGRKRPSQTLLIEARCLSHLEAMVQQGFDTEPFRIDELLSLLREVGETAQRQDAATILVLASTSGWDEECTTYISASAEGRSFYHRLLMPYLVDLHTGGLHYNMADERLAAFADLFKLPLATEQVLGIMEHIRGTLVVRSGLSADEVVQELHAAPTLVERAFHKLADEGGCRLQQDDELGLVILRAG